MSLIISEYEEPILRTNTFGEIYLIDDMTNKLCGFPNFFLGYNPTDNLFYLVNLNKIDFTEGCTDLFDNMFIEYCITEISHKDDIEYLFNSTKSGYKNMLFDYITVYKNKTYIMTLTQSTERVVDFSTINYERLMNTEMINEEIKFKDNIMEYIDSIIRED